jgi:hypothetical protein
MADKIQYIIAFVFLIIVIKLVLDKASKDKRIWQTCAQKYRMNFSEGVETRGERQVKVFRLKGYYRSCLVNITGSRALGQNETHISVTYPKGLMDGLRLYPEGTLGKIGRGLVKQATVGRSSRQPYFVTMPPPKGTGQLEVQKELNPLIREQLTQLFIICSGKGRRIDVTDAYMLIKQVGFVQNPEGLFPLVDEVLTAINVVESNSGELLK